MQKSNMTDSTPKTPLSAMPNRDLARLPAAAEITTGSTGDRGYGRAHRRYRTA